MIDLSDITILTATFNRHDFTISMIKSFFDVFKIGNIILPQFIVLDNSTSCPFPDTPNPIIKVIDNTNFKYTCNYNQPSMNHSASIDWAIKNLIHTKYIMLCDNDILFKPNICLLTEKRFSYNLVGEIGWDRVPPARLYPYWCIIDNAFITQHRLNYFDQHRCMINNATMDTGCSFYEDAVHSNATIYKIKLSDYIIHLKGGTLRNKSLNELHALL